MSRIRLGLIALLLFCSLTAVTAHLTVAQDDDPFKGTTIVGLGSIVPARSADNTMSLVQLTLEPGASIAMHHHPGPVIISVASGEFTTSFSMGTITLNTAARDGAEASSAPMEVGKKYVLKAGDSIAYDDDAMGHYMANEGTEPLVLVAATLWTTGADGFVFENAGTATPTS